MTKKRQEKISSTSSPHTFVKKYIAYKTYEKLNSMQQEQARSNILVYNVYNNDFFKI